jgi:hypothetical protein
MNISQKKYAINRVAEHVTTAISRVKAKDIADTAIYRKAIKLDPKEVIKAIRSGTVKALANKDLIKGTHSKLCVEELFDLEPLRVAALKGKGITAALDHVDAIRVRTPPMGNSKHFTPREFYYAKNAVEVVRLIEVFDELSDDIMLGDNLVAKSAIQTAESL